MSKALIVGMGCSGKAAKALLAGAHWETDERDGCDLVVASPGVRVISELQLGCEALRARGVRLMAVTGSKGKSSVVKLVADALSSHGQPAVACGNYGLPVSGVGDCVWAVVEVSSFQLETTHLPPGTFEAAAVLNLQEDHLDRHGCVEVYHALKLGLLNMAKVGLSPDCLQRLSELDATRALLRGSYFDNDILRANGAAAVALLRVAGLSDADIAASFRAFVPLAHRLEPVAELGGVRYIDDSKATSIAALMAGVTMAGGPGADTSAPRIRLIAGGLAKGDDPRAALSCLTKRVKKVYLIGNCAEKFFAAWNGAVACERCGTLEQAVAATMREAVAGEIVLLSPGTASFDQFKSFEERGDVFTQLVKKER